mgnify:CR=1 FL=1
MQLDANNSSHPKKLPIMHWVLALGCHFSIDIKVETILLHQENEGLIIWPCHAWGKGILEYSTYVGGGIEEAIGIGGKGGDEVSLLASSDDETSLKASSSLAQLPDFFVFSALSAAPVVASDFREALASKEDWLASFPWLRPGPAWVFACWSDLCIRSLRSASKK